MGLCCVCLVYLLSACLFVFKESKLLLNLIEEHIFGSGDGNTKYS